ncbi:MAG: YifB family Mg chelatase-like AAA ATPase [Clostridia bacterium]|nr:YifB family Mg chelatase-like AAA ATPase [Clostridia bacterium]
MVARVMSVGLDGIEGYPLVCECDLSSGLPSFDIVGLPDAAVKESRERVRAAIKNCGFEFPLRRITVNLAPGDRRKSGALYDLPILLSILLASEQLEGVPEGTYFLGEVALDGSLRPIRGALPAAVAALDAGAKRLIVPFDNAAEAALASERIAVFGGKTVAEVISAIPEGNGFIRTLRPDVAFKACYDVDFSEVKGQETAKRALEIAAAGGHNLLMCGPPGSGKSMLARRLPTILPDLTEEEVLETTKIHSVAGLTSRENPMVLTRPFRAPHHTTSPVSLTGGGHDLHPGEVSLAHNGVLFLDEFPEFARSTIDSMRQPLEDGFVTVTRSAGSVRYPSRFMLVGAMNPCRCGWYGHPSGKCTCSRGSVDQYRSRISGPMLDRMDIFVDVPEVKYSEISSVRPSESSEDIRRRVNAARRIQLERYSGMGVTCNAGMPASMTDRVCTLGQAESNLMKMAFDRLGLSARSYTRILRISRTIADLAASERILIDHIAEALQYRPTLIK